MKKLIVKHKLELIGVTLGALAGWGYWYFVGCASGTCGITSKPLNSSLYGAFIGGLFLSMFKKENRKKEEK